MRSTLLRLGCALGALALSACSVPREAGFPDVARSVEQRTGHRIFWNRGGEADAQVQGVVRGMLAHELSVQEAVQIALLDNASLQATYEELAIAQADLVQAGLLKNPTFSGFFHFPTSKDSLPHAGLAVEQDFLDILMIPAKKRIAAAAFEAMKLRVGGAVVELAYGVREAYFTLQGAQQIAAMRRMVFEAAHVSLEVAQRQHEAGNLSDLDVASEQGLFEQARADLARAQAETVGARERLTRLLGLWGPDAGFRVAEKLPELPPEEAPLEHLETLALTQRLDIAAARQDLQANAYALAAARDFRWIGGLRAGVAYERDFGSYDFGPTAALELPLFDQKQAMIARVEAQFRRSGQELRARAVSVRSEVREARARVLFARSVVEYDRTVLIPLRERIVALSQEHYNAMLLGVYQLLLAKQAEVNAYRETIEAARDYWIARADLGRAVGGRLSAAP